ncbi:YhjD/YihY/BrkB family envelope integrity protein [Ectothiorhodospira mobilis]|uniref:YhjD/YihY/BrkB family envelope integrity protein n=1 Tax=Ectothiorhodospira mobilis TaxID=195064 RepID=UPI001EE7F85C|nr:YhjD/YihY/BrkB family envelope integrity protein [Ectothiorhodospira mobilis]MCG5534854.1 YihY family inner membrane protein [Ectothiorhodospira mobilis]
MTLKGRSQALLHLLAEEDARRLPRLQGRLLMLARAGVLIGREVAGGPLNLHAMSLVYTSLLSMVPLLALAFSVLKAFGAHNAVEPFLLTLLEPLGDQGAQIVANVVQFVENMRVGVLGFAGLVFLFFTVVGMIQKVEAAFNYIWQVSTPRRLVQKFSNYLSVILVGPVLVFSALGITASVMATDIVQRLMAYGWIGGSVELLSRLVPYLLIALAFTFIYILVPNTRVRPLPALGGGVAAALLWQTTGWGFAALMAGSTRYDAIYSGFAIMIMLLFWLYLNWLILLVGSQVAHFLQNPQRLRAPRPAAADLPTGVRERLALAVMVCVARRFAEGAHPPREDDLVRALGQPPEAIHAVLGPLGEGGLVVPAGTAAGGYLPARDPGRIPLLEVLESVRRGGVPEGEAEGPLGAVYREMDAALRGVLAGRSLRALVEAQESAGVSPKTEEQ